MWEENGWTFVLVKSYQDKEQNHVEHRNKSPLGFHVLSYSSSAVINQMERIISSHLKTNDTIV